MKIKILNSLVFINLLTILLVLSIFIIPSVPLRYILGVPLLLFFPGYALYRVLFVQKKETDYLELIAVSAVTSAAVTALIGFALNYTQLGVRLVPVIASVTAFIFATSIIALARQAASPGGIKLWNELDFSPNHEQATGKKNGYTIIAIMVLAVLVLGGFLAVRFKANETYSEFYVLGLDKTAENYPSSFLIKSGKIAGVNYTNGDVVDGQWGRVFLNVINHEGSAAAYSIKVNIDNRPSDLMYGNSTFQDYSFRLNDKERWSGEIGFSPTRPGINQKVDFLLFKDGKQQAENTLTLWVDAQERMP